MEAHTMRVQQHAPHRDYLKRSKLKGQNEDGKYIYTRPPKWFKGIFSYTEYCTLPISPFLGYISYIYIISWNLFSLKYKKALMEHLKEMNVKKRINGDNKQNSKCNNNSCFYLSCFKATKSHSFHHFNFFWAFPF